MALYIFIAAVTIFLGCMVKKYPLCEEPATSVGRSYFGYTSRTSAVNFLMVSAIFVVLTALAALRLEVGNDYGTYVVTCHEIFQRGYVVTEPGYNFVVRLLYTLSGKEDYLLMFGVFGAAIVAIFLKVIWDQSDSFALSFFIFMTMGFYYRSFNTVRYYFALAIATFALRYLMRIDVQGMIKCAGRVEGDHAHDEDEHGGKSKAVASHRCFIQERHAENKCGSHGDKMCDRAARIL